MLDSLTSKLLGLPVYLWVLAGAGALYVYAHHKSTTLGGPPLEQIGNQPATPPSPIAPVFVYNPTPMGAFGGSNPYGGVPAQ